MNSQNYEQQSIDHATIGDAKDFLKENISVQILFYNGKPIAIELPTFIEAKIKEPFISKGNNDSSFLNEDFNKIKSNIMKLPMEKNISNQIGGLLNINISIIMKVRNLLIHGKPFTSTNSINLNATVENKSNPIILSNEELRIRDMIEIIKYLENNDLLSIESNSILNQKIDQSKIEILFEKRVIQHFLDKTKLFYDHIEKVK